MRRLAITSALLAALTSSALAHEQGSVTLSAKTAAPGGQLTVRGEKLGKAGTFSLQLRGVLNTYQLASIRTDTSGRFDREVGLPAAARAGAYTVVVVASDGDVVARAELTLDAGAAPHMAGMAQMPGHEGMAGMQPTHATAEMMDVRVNTAAAEWVAIAALVLASAAAGVFLLFRLPARD